MQSGSIYSRFTRLQRITFVLFVIVLFNWLMLASTGYTIAGGDLFTVFFLIFLALLGVTLTRPLVQRLWRNMGRSSRDAEASTRDTDTMRNGETGLGRHQKDRFKDGRVV